MLTNPSNVIAWESMPELTPLATLWTPMPGSNRFTSTSPRASDTMEALTNHSMAFPPTRPTVPASAMWPIPTTSVENTSGPMIILIRRRKIVLPTRCSLQSAFAWLDRVMVMNQPASGDAQQHRHEYIGCHPAGLHRPPPPYQPLLQQCCSYLPLMCNGSAGPGTMCRVVNGKISPTSYISND